jgi:hypothetical protein
VIRKIIVVGMALILLAGCSDSTPVPDPLPTWSDPPVKSPDPVMELQPAESESVYYKNCTELRKDHPEGVPANNPGYRLKLDRDKDGTACEIV